MKQLIQNLKTGETSLIEVPVPKIGNGNILIKTERSLVSLGTEKMLVEFGKSNLISKAKQQPEKVKQVLDKIKSDGLMPTLEAVFNKLDEPLSLGYCNAGEVIGVGEEVKTVKVGDRVISNGPHAEIVSVPKNLVAKIPENVSYEEASFTVIGSIGLQGIRLIKPTYGETVVVIGLGLIGLISVQILLANGCNVIGFDYDEDKVNLAEKFGVSAYKVGVNIDEVEIVNKLTNNIGADAVLITASTKSNDVISNSAKMCRKRGRVVLVGVIGLNINRSDFYAKEITFQVSCSYGPGRYDEVYENKGIDYPIGFVRWTEERNFRAILNGISKGEIDVKSLITEEIDFKDFNKIYSNLGKNNSIASILKYSDNISKKDIVEIGTNKFNGSEGGIAIIGAGNFTKMTMMPMLKKIDSPVKYIVSNGGLSASNLAKKYKIPFSTTDYQSVLNDPEVGSVIITTRHNLHADLAIKALENNKHVFVEKPLSLNKDQLHSIIQSFNQSREQGLNISLTVGFNRRFSPFVLKAKSLVADPSSLNMIATMNAGFIPPEVWVHDLKIGGGRIIGEACHFMDLAVFLTGSLIKTVSMSSLGDNFDASTDNAILTLKFENGAQAVVNYFSNGSKSYSKERVELYSQNKTLVIDNFREIIGYGFKGFKKMKSKQDKGHFEQFKRYFEFIKNGGSPLIPFEELINVSKASFAAIESLKSGKTIEVI